MSSTNPYAAAEEAVAKAEAAATVTVTMAEAASLVDVALAEAIATLGDAQAETAYQLTISILKDGEVELIPALIALELAAIAEGLAAYAAEQEAAAAAFKLSGASEQIAFSLAGDTFNKDSQNVSNEYEKFEQAVKGMMAGALA